MYDDATLLSNDINNLTKKTTSDFFTKFQDVLPPKIFYILCHKWPHPLDMVLTSLPGTIFELRASEVSDVVCRALSGRSMSVVYRWCDPGIAAGLRGGYRPADLTVTGRRRGQSRSRLSCEGGGGNGAA